MWPVGHRMPRSTLNQTELWQCSIFINYACVICIEHKLESDGDVATLQTDLFHQQQIHSYLLGS